MIARQIEQTVRKSLFKKKAVVIYGSRQVGKTTLVKKILQDFKDESIYLNCDQPDIAHTLTNKTSTELYEFMQQKRLVVLDEAQRVENIGLTIKLMVDTYPKIQIIATGSSSFELANKINEPLTGRAKFFRLYPLSYAEIAVNSRLEAHRKLTKMLRFGTFPAIWQANEQDARLQLNDLTTNFLYKDLLEFDLLRQTPLLTRLLRALALQLGNEVSYTELAGLLGVDVKTIDRYIFLLEQVFIIFRLQSFKRNSRTEISRLRKVYFYDLGVRNSLIQNFNEIELRNDIGALWENFCIVERLKRNEYSQKFANSYFWRNYQGQEIDYIEEVGGKLNAYEFKWNPKKKASLPTNFSQQYPENTFSVVTPGSLPRFLST